MEEVVVVSTSMAKRMKTSDGKKKIDVTKKVMKKTSRQVTFSKRRQGLFKKCDELCLNYGSEIALITFSEAGNCFPYGNPNPDSVLERFLNSSGSSDGVNYGGSGNCGGFWWDEVEVDKLGLSELEEFKVALERLKNEVVSRVDGINQGLGFDHSMNEDVSSVVDIKPDFSMINDINQGLGFDNSLERSRNEVVSSVVDIKQDYSTSDQGLGFDNSMERSMNEVVLTLDDIKQDYSTSDQGLGFDNSLESSSNDVFSSIIDDITITQDFTMSNQGIGFDDIDFDGDFAGSFNDQFGIDFDFNFEFCDLINNGLGPEVPVPDTSLLQHLQVQV